MNNEILKPYVSAPAMSLGGHFGVNDENRINTANRKDASYSNIMRSIVSTHPELAENAELYEVVSEMLKEEMQPSRTK